MTVQLRYYQAEAVKCAFDYLYGAQTGNGLIGMPTGSGKSIVINSIVAEARRQFPICRAMIATHVKELVNQNAKNMEKFWPEAPIGVFSAGLRRRDTAHPILYAGIQSAAKVPEAFGHIDLLLIDEAHLVSPKESTQYMQFIKVLRSRNPYLRVFGFTATMFRTEHGQLVDDGGIWTDCVYNITDMDGFNRLVREGYLCPLIAKRTDFEYDLSNVEVDSFGEYDEKSAAAAMNKDELSYRAMQECCRNAYDRRSWLIFAQDKLHSERLSDILNSLGVTSTFVHSGVPSAERDRRIEAYKRGEYRAIANYGVLTTGFDDPKTDFIAVCRAIAKSAGLWVQILGRGTRISPETGKLNCLVLDFCGNSRRLGPINDPKLPTKRGPNSGSSSTGEIPIKVCMTCGAYNHPRNRFCECCSTEFMSQVILQEKASEDEVMRFDAPVIEELEVSQVMYLPHQAKAGGQTTMKATYFCGTRYFEEWVAFESPSHAGRYLAEQWWRQRHASPVPTTTAKALEYIQQLRCPRVIRVQTNTEFPKIIGYEY